MLIREDDLPVGMIDDNDAQPAAGEQRQRLVTGGPIADEHALEIEMEGSARNRAGGEEVRLPRSQTVDGDLDVGACDQREARVGEEPVERVTAEGAD